MTGPDGQSSKRDQRREARRQQLQRQQVERRRQRERQIRQQRLQRGGIVLAAVVAVVIIGLLVAHFAFGAFGGSGGAQQHAHGQVIDGLACTQPPKNAHYQLAEIELYVNGQRTTVPDGIGIVSSKNCRYPVYVPSGEPNAVASLAGGSQGYVLGNLFDLWGKTLSSGQVLGDKADVHHPLTFEVATAGGTLAPYTGDPRGIALGNHETVVILYNSASVKPSAYSNWGSLHN